jgi:CcmD family protein
MYEFLTKNSLYVVLCVAMTVWIGIAYFLFRLERSVSRLEQQSSSGNEQSRTSQD